MGSGWVHLRLCLACGHVGCCDNSPNRHATAHNRQTHHPLIRSFEPGEDWGWCYVDELLFESLPGSLTTEWCGALGVTPGADAGTTLAQEDALVEGQGVNLSS